MTQPKPIAFEQWTQARHLARYLVYALVGPGLPMVLALITIPKILELLGAERFGLLTMMWIVLGYFSLFDFGLGRASARMFAEKLGQGRIDDLRPLGLTSLAATLGLGLVGSIVLVAISPWLVGSALKIDPGLQAEALATLRWVAATVPFISLAGGLKAILEARQKFRLTNILQALIGALLYLAPLAVLHFQNRLEAVAATLFLGRTLSALVYLYFFLRELPPSPQPILQRSLLGPLLKNGGWMTVTNVVGPIIVYIDRFLIGSLISLAAVAFYATPFEIVTRFSVISSAIGQILFPAMATFHATDPEKTRHLFNLGLQAISALVFPLLFGAFVFAPELLHLWVGETFRAESAWVLRILAFGTFTNMLAQVPFTFIQSYQRADVTAKLHLIELVVYLPLLAAACRLWGLDGAALAWTARTTIDLFALLWLGGRLSRHPRGFMKKSVLLTLGALALFVSGLFPATLAAKAALFVAGSTAFYAIIYAFALEPGQRRRLLRLARLKTP